MIEFISLVFGIIIGFVLGFVVGKLKVYQQADLSTQLSAISSLETQIAEMKIKFEEIEKMREKLETEREKRLRNFIEMVQKVDKEKEKRIQEWMKQTKEFFEEQKKNTEKFLLEQGKSREEIEKRRDAQIRDMMRIIKQFNQIVLGTKKRGRTGEVILKEVLKESIRVGLVKTNLKTSNGEVEFAWDLGDGKYIPIDSKMPDVFELLERYNSSEEEKERNRIKKQIFDKVKKEIELVKKYQNLSNTIDSCILVVPEVVLEISPELVSEGKKHNVFICSYKEVFPIAHIIQDEYIRFKEEGDIGEYKKIIKTLFYILENINKKVETIDRAIKTIKNANDGIRSEIVKGKDVNFVKNL